MSYSLSPYLSILHVMRARVVHLFCSDLFTSPSFFNLLLLGTCPCLFLLVLKPISVFSFFHLPSIFRFAQLPASHFYLLPFFLLFSCPPRLASPRYHLALRLQRPSNGKPWCLAKKRKNSKPEGFQIQHQTA